MESKKYGTEYQKNIDFLRKYHPDAGTSCIRTQPLQDVNNQTALDIIIPAYNVEHYIGTCLKSVLKQETQYPFRMIVVDDGSSDRTGEVIDRYKDTDEVVVIHQENMGLAGARNKGLLYSQAKYIMFLDSDDILAKKAVESMVSRIEREEGSVLGGSYCNFRIASFLHRNYYQRSGTLNSELDLFGQSWGKIYRRDMFERVQFPQNYWFEDSLMQQIVFPLAGKKLGISDIVYMRRVNLKSITHNAAGNPKSVDTLWVTLRLMDDREKLGIENDNAYYRYLLHQTCLNHQRLRGMEREIRRAAFMVMAIRLQELFPEENVNDKDEANIAKAVQEMDYDLFYHFCES